MRAETVERILDAATDLMRSHGFASTSVEAVAKAAGHTTGAIFANFRSKDELLEAVMERLGVWWFDDLSAELGAARSPRNLVVRARRWRDAYLADAGDRFVLDAEFWLVAARNEAVRGRVLERFAAGERVLARTIEGLAERFGLTSITSSGTAASLLIASVLGMHTQARFDLELGRTDAFPATVALLLGIDADVVARTRAVP